MNRIILSFRILKVTHGLHLIVTPILQLSVPLEATTSIITLQGIYLLTKHLQFDHDLWQIELVFSLFLSQLHKIFVMNRPFVETSVRYPSKINNIEFENLNAGKWDWLESLGSLIAE